MNGYESYLITACISLVVSTCAVLVNHYILKRCRKYNQQFIDEDDQLNNEDKLLTNENDPQFQLS